MLPMIVHIMDQPELAKGEGPIAVISTSKCFYLFVLFSVVYFGWYICSFINTKYVLLHVSLHNKFMWKPKNLPRAMEYGISNILILIVILLIQ